MKDLNGEQLEENDVINIPCKIISFGIENMVVQTIHNINLNPPRTIVVNSKQVLKVK